MIRGAEDKQEKVEEECMRGVNDKTGVEKRRLRRNMSLKDR